MEGKFPEYGRGEWWNIRELGRVSLDTREVFVDKHSLKIQGKRETARGFARLALLGACCAALGAAGLISTSSARAGSGIRGAQDKDGAGITFSKQATPKEVGLPAYPGAKLHKDEKDDSASVAMGLWGESFGFKLAVMKMESGDAPEKIAEFYKKALGKYGTVLNCSNASPSAKDKDESSNKLTCDDDKPEKGGLVFKAGTKEKQHVVAIQADGKGSLFQLVYVEARGDDRDKKAN
jgi:hypothetical protein